MLNYSYTQATISVAVESGAKITAESVLKWTSDNPNDKSLHTSMIIEGDVLEKGRTYAEKWTFDWNTESQGGLEVALQGIYEYILTRKIPEHGRRHEVFTEVLPWIRVGWIDEEGKWYGYITVNRQGKEMASRFAGWEALSEVRTALKRALNP